MDYKEKYEMALETIQEILDSGEDSIKMSRLKLRLQSVFHELKESEDEKIRTWPIGYFYQYKEDGVEKYANGLKVESIIAWLEKQGKMDMESYKVAEDEKREFVGDGFIKCYANFQDFKEGETYWLEYVGNDNYNVRSDNLLGKTYHITPYQIYTVFKKQTWLEKQGEPTDNDMVEALRTEYEKGKADAIAEMEKPTWSVEDMSKVQRICKYLDEAKKYYADITEVRECIDWLKSLQRIGG